jgi:hypothetical protein
MAAGSNVVGNIVANIVAGNTLKETQQLYRYILAFGIFFSSSNVLT